MKLKSLLSLRKWVGFYLGTGLGKRLPDKQFIELEYYSYMGKVLDLRNPRSFNEKLQWLKVYDRNSLYTTMVDKLSAKEFAANIIGQRHIIPTYGVWDTPAEIDFDMLPQQFVLKVTHDSGGLVICRDRTQFDKEQAVRKLEKSLQRDYYRVHREWPYKNVRRRVFAEAYMEDEQCGQGLTDYKFFCFNGHPRFLYISQGLEEHATAKISFFDFNGKQLPFSRSDYRPFSGDMVLPSNFEEMISLAEKIAKVVSNPFVRVDLYSIQGEIYFSEITFYPCSGMIPFKPLDWDYELGTWIDLPQIRSEP